MTINKLPTHVQKFAKDGNKELYVLFADLFNEYRVQQGETGITFDTLIPFAKKEAAVDMAFKKEILRIAGLGKMDEFPLATYATNPQLVWAAFAVVSALIDTVVPQAIVDSIGLYTEVKNIAWGDTAIWDIEARDLFAVSKAGRAKRQAQIRKQYRGQVALNPEMHQISVGVSLYRVLAGQESLATFVMKAAQSMSASMTRDAYASFAVAMDALPAGLTEAGFSASGFITLAQKVSAWNQSKAIAVCTALAAQQILPDNANYRYTLDDDFVRLGYVRNFKGTDVIILPQVAKFETEFDLVLDDTKIWLLSPARGKMVKLAIEGNTLANTTGHMDNADLQSVATISSAWEAGIATSALGGIIEL